MKTTEIRKQPDFVQVKKNFLNILNDPENTTFEIL